MIQLVTTYNLKTISFLTILVSDNNIQQICDHFVQQLLYKLVRNPQIRMVIHLDQPNPQIFIDQKIKANQLE